MANINHKRGDTFQLNFTLTDSADAATLMLLSTSPTTMYGLWLEMPPALLR
jgi:hypothetical protein